MSQVSSAADLTASLRRTSSQGERPPPLVGCSVTVLNDSVYVFGGRLVPTRTMVSTLYELNLKTLVWKLLSPKLETTSTEGSSTPSPPPPRARYFHSCCPWGDDKLVIFGGEGYNETILNPEDENDKSNDNDNDNDNDKTAPTLETLDDLHIFNTLTQEWENVGEIKLGKGVEEKPKPRYAHLGVVCTAWDSDNDGESKSKSKSKSCLMIMGGQDLKNTYLHTSEILDLDTMTWIQTGKWDRHIGTYRAIATSSNCTVKPRRTDGEITNLSWTERNSLKEPEPLLLFSNFNFTQVRRDLDLLSSPLSSSPASRLAPTSLSSSMTGTSLPPGLRFPSGFQLGNHLIIFGTFLSQHVNNFSIWALNLGSLEWSRIDPGNVLQKGSWNRAVGWKNNVIVLGDRERDIATDYDHRQTNFTHLAFIDLEAHGIYQPPCRSLPLLAQRFGLETLSQPFLTDFEIVCSDGKRLACCKKILEERWEWFRDKVLEFKLRASGLVIAQNKRSQDASLENSENGSFKSSEIAVSRSITNTTTTTTSTTTGNDSSSEATRLIPRTLNLPEPSSTVLGFLQYLYTLSLCTPLQLSLPILNSLLLFSQNYKQDNLKSLCVHALHEELTKEELFIKTGGGSTGSAGSAGSGSVAPAIYEAATLGGCTALQIRALKCLMNNASSSATTRNPASRNGNGLMQQQQQQSGSSGGQGEPMARQASQDAHGTTHSTVPSASSGTIAPTHHAYNSLSTRSSLGSVQRDTSPAVPFLPPASSSPLAPHVVPRQDSLLGTAQVSSFSISIPIDAPAPLDPHRVRRSRKISSNKEDDDLTRLAIQQQEGKEEDEIFTFDPHVQAPTSPVKLVDVTSTRVSIDGSGESQSIGNGERKLSIAGLLNNRKEEKGEPGAREVWYPTFLDSVQVASGGGRGGTDGNPLSGRKATRINLEHLALLELQEPSLPLPLTTRVVSSPKRTSSLIARSPDSANSFLSLPSTASSSSIRPNQSSSIPMNRTPSSASSSGRSMGSSVGSEVVTPPMPSSATFETVIVHEEEEEVELELSPSPSPKFPGFFRSSSKTTSASTSPQNLSPSPPSTQSRRFSLSSSPNPSTSHSSSSNSSTTRLSKSARTQLEIEVGTKLLRASGASEKEIGLRARNVGFQVLKARESGEEIPSNLIMK